MANNKSAIKRIRIHDRKKKENKPYKSMVKTYIKKYLTSLADYEEQASQENYVHIQECLSLAYSKIDKAQKKKIFHTNQAARKKSRLTKAFAKLSFSLS